MIIPGHFINPLRIQRRTPSGDGVKSSDTKNKVEHVIYPWKAEILVISTLKLQKKKKDLRCTLDLNQMICEQIKNT